jgi:large subunit ribosomal protein L25
MADVLEVSKRETQGTRLMRRLRSNGFVPAILYGHGEANVSLSVPQPQLMSTIRHGRKLVDLRGDLSEQALIRSVQWDTYGMHVLHVDFTRVSVGEKVKITVAIELRGEAPGAKEGGVVEHVVHEVEIECPVDAIPDKFELRVSNLHLGQSLTLADLPLPEGARLLDDPESIVVHCVTPKATEEELAAPLEAIEPELIRKEKSEDEEGSEE